MTADYGRFYDDGGRQALADDNPEGCEVVKLLEHDKTL